MIKLPATDFPVEKLINTARAAKEAAYAPYSRLRVGAALLTVQGRLYKGCNIENASYSLAICAERVALFKALSEGEKDICALAVISDLDEHCTPCGSCRQVLAEFGTKMKIFMCNNSGQYHVQTVAQLLPLFFKL